MNAKLEARMVVAMIRRGRCGGGAAAHAYAAAASNGVCTGEVMSVDLVGGRRSRPRVLKDFSLCGPESDLSERSRAYLAALFDAFQDLTRGCDGSLAGWDRTSPQPAMLQPR
jgi:hypothetical protein